MMTVTLPAFLVGCVLSTAAGPVTVEVAADDGAVLRGCRYPADGDPIICVHGLAANLHQFDANGDDQNLARHLQNAGFDVWLWNLRGAGTGELESALPPSTTGWNADEHIVWDLPAVVGHVARTTQKHPFVAGHSLGGMCLAAYLCGARPRVEGTAARGIVMDREVARKRQSEIAGAVFLSTPARLAWTTDGEPRALTTIARLTSELHAGRLVPERVRLSRVHRLQSEESSPIVRGFVEALENAVSTQLGDEGLLAQAFGSNQARALAIFRKFRARVLSDASRGVLVQLAESVNRETWQSALPPPDGGAVYSNCYGAITCRVLVVLGAGDRIADPELVRRDFFEKIASSDRTLLIVGGYGHSDVTLAPECPRDIFSPIENWLEQRRSALRRQP